ncbi:MAG: hypothetical protein ACYDCK_06965 [Thermoplasmatota archaeon]
MAVPLAFATLASVLLVLGFVADAQSGTRHFDGRFRIRAPYGNEALWLFVAAGVFVPANLARRWWAPRVLAGARSTSSRLAWKRFAAWMKKYGIVFHMLAGVAVFGVGMAHGLLTGHGNLALWTGMGALGAMLLLGLVLYFLRRARWVAKSRGALLVVKWVLTVAAVGLLFYGHATARIGAGA